MSVENIRVNVQKAVDSTLLSNEVLARVKTNHDTVVSYLGNAASKLTGVSELVRAIKENLESSLQLTSEMTEHVETAQTHIEAASLPSESEQAQAIMEHTTALRGKAAIIQRNLSAPFSEDDGPLHKYGVDYFVTWAEEFEEAQSLGESLNPHFDDALQANDRGIAYGQAYLNSLRGSTS